MKANLRIQASGDVTAARADGPRAAAHAEEAATLRQIWEQGDCRHRAAIYSTPHILSSYGEFIMLAYTEVGAHISIHIPNKCKEFLADLLSAMMAYLLKVMRHLNRPRSP